MFAITVMTAALLTAAPSYQEVTYEDLVFEARYDCRNANPEKTKDKILWDLVKIEKAYELPNTLRGMVLAASCMESGHDPNAKGDYKVFKNKRLPRAIGILQQWPWYEKEYGIDRTNHIEAASSWMKHIKRKLNKVRKNCGFKSKHRNWVAAWVTAIRYPKEGGRCHEHPKHYKLLRRWHRQIKKSLDKGDGC